MNAPTPDLEALTLHISSTRLRFGNGISADPALRLSRTLGLSDVVLINMQAHYDAEIARGLLATQLATIQRIA